MSTDAGGILRCSLCGVAPAAPSQKYCRSCHKAYMRQWRRRHPMTDDQRFKDSVRSYAGVYKRRGKLVPGPCEDCGAADTQMHHPDYNQPLLVIWLCQPCHRARHL